MAKKILAIDDENDILVMVRTVLASEGYEVSTAVNGYDGLALAQEVKPDLIILDLLMPEMDGFEVLKHLKDNQATEAIPVIVLTGVDEREKLQMALDYGVAFYIVKPFDYQDLIAKVREALEET